MKVSVIIPAYNHEEYIGIAIESVLYQTFQDFELIIINDGSTDNTDQVIRKYSDPRISYVPQENQGAHNAINKGISLARGEYISILNSDDVYHAERLGKCVDLLEMRKDCSVVITEIEGIDAGGNVLKEEKTRPIISRPNKGGGVSPWLEAMQRTKAQLGKKLLDSWRTNKKQRGSQWLRWYNDVLSIFEQSDFLPAAFTQNILVTTSNYFMRREVFDKVGTFRGLRFAHDWDMLLRLACRFKIHLLNERLLQYRVHEHNTIVETDSFIKTKFEVNWLIAENMRALPRHVDIVELFNAVKVNGWISLELLVVLLSISDGRQRADLLDFGHPLTGQMMSML